VSIIGGPLDLAGTYGEVFPGRCGGTRGPRDRDPTGIKPWVSAGVRRGGAAVDDPAALLVEDAGWTVEDLRTVTVNALKSAFIPFDERTALIEDVVLPGYAAAL